MGKHSLVKENRPRDFWATVDPDAVKPLIPYILNSNYAEVCIGDGDLVKLIGLNANCVWGSDVNGDPFTYQCPAEDLTEEDMRGVDYIITNPPFSWEMLEPMLKVLPKLKPTWLLLPADFMHNKRSGPYMKKCKLILSVRRLYWVPEDGGKGVKGKDNYCWFLFDDDHTGDTVFHGS